jgi:hypothetical protein
MTSQELIANAPEYLQIAGSIIGAAAVVATFTPTPADDGILMIAKRILDIFACNFGKAKNKK